VYLILLLVGCNNDSAPGSASGAPDSQDSPPALTTADLPEGSLPAAGWAGAGSVLLTDVEVESVRIQTVAAEHRSLASYLSAMGRVLAHQYRQAIISYPFPARIAEIHVRAGDWVRPGDPLVVLQSEEVGEATSAFYSANADHELAQVNFERESQLFESGVGARKNLSSAEAGLRVAEASLNAAEKKLHVLGFTEEEIGVLSETHQVNPIITLFAPIAGKVIENDMVLGGMVDEATEILTIMDLSRLWVEADVYEKDIARIRNGQKVVVSVPAYAGDSFRGVITYVGDVLDPDTRTITVRTEVDNTDSKLKPGMFAALAIELSQNGTALVVPSEAVLDDEGEYLVFIRLDGNRFEPRHVTVGTRENGFIEVTGGLEAGEQVVTNGNFQLKSKLYEAVLKAGHVH
ncbi:MAG: efflux RND transporter periplasmic adaptor subunit, partial [Gemmatimonadota bacterium]